MFKRKRPEQPTPDDLLQPGELVRVRSYAGARADEEPRAIVIGGHEIPIDEVLWRAIVEDASGRTRAFVVRAGGRRVRLGLRDDTWEIERILPR